MLSMYIMHLNLIKVCRTSPSPKNNLALDPPLIIEILSVLMACKRNCLHLLSTFEQCVGKQNVLFIIKTKIFNSTNSVICYFHHYFFFIITLL